MFETQRILVIGNISLNLSDADETVTYSNMHKVTYSTMPSASGNSASGHSQHLVFETQWILVIGNISLNLSDADETAI